MMRFFGMVAAGALAGCVVASCSGGETPAAGADPLRLINAGDGKVCAHPEVLATLRSVLARPRGDERLILPISSDQIAKLKLPELTIDRIALVSHAPATKTFTCQAMAAFDADIGGPAQHFEKAVTYEVKPALDDETSFLVYTADGFAADLINIAITQEAARQIQESSTAAPEAAEAAEAVAGPAPPLEDWERKLSPDYHRCMEAADGINADMTACASAELQRQDARLNASYQAAMAARADAGRQALRTAQRAWIQGRDAKCREELNGGSMDRLLEDTCHLQMTVERTDELEAGDPG